MKITCPICNEPGYLVRYKSGEHYYMRVDHMKYVDGKIVRRVCYLGKDTSMLASMVDEIMGNGSSRNNSSRKILWFPGGDYYIAEDILLPRIEKLCVYDKCTFVEVFGGSGYVSQTINRARFGNIVYNDIDSRLVTFYKIVKENPDLLTQLIATLPYSRTIHRITKTLLKSGNRELAALEMAALLFYGVNSSVNGIVAKAGFSYTTHPDKSKPKEFMSKTRNILRLAAAWRDIIIENLDFREVIKRYDSEKTVFYCDPPYVPTAKEYYGKQFTVDDLRDLANMLTTIKGKFLLKLNDRSYSYIQDIMPESKYVVEHIELPLYHQVRKKENRDKWVMVLVSSKLTNE
jgi:DNA adenine methylase